MENNDKNIKFYKPFILAMATGLYPIFFYFSNNYSLINTWKHLGFFIALFLALPFVLFFILDLLFKKRENKTAELPLKVFVNTLLFLLFIQLCLYAKLQIILTVITICIAVVLGFVAKKYLKQIVVFQLLLAVLGLISFVPVVAKQLSYSDKWQQLPDDIKDVSFVRKPNVYYIQPDGYVNYKEIERGLYNIDNSSFYTFLDSLGFKQYPNMRSNYNSTLTSNTATFSMKHHYNNSGFNFTETINGRELLISKNAVLDIFKKNNYKTHFIAEFPYLLANRPTMGYDVCNFNYSEMDLLQTGLSKSKEVFPFLSKLLNTPSNTPSFYFIELFKPGHVPAQEADTKGHVIEKENWIENLNEANQKLIRILSLIKEKDPEALIVIQSDHGGYVGFDYMMQMREKTQDRDKLYSIFSTTLAIHWPEQNVPKSDTLFKTNVNTFRILFSYLGDRQEYLQYREPDVSYLIINKGAPKAVYSVIDSTGNITFKKKD